MSSQPLGLVLAADSDLLLWLTEMEKDDHSLARKRVIN